MKKSTTLYKRVKQLSLPMFILFLMFTLGINSGIQLHAQEGVAPTIIPDGGFAVDGNLLARTPVTGPFSADNGDFLPNENAPGSGGYVFDLSGIPSDSLTSFHIIEGYDNNDPDVFTGGSKFEMDPNDWAWMPGSTPPKDDINHILFFFSGDTLGNIWFVGASDREKASGNTYVDFELYQNPLYKNPDGSFTSMGPHGGRTVGDLAITIEFVNGGIDPHLYIYKWDSISQATYSYVLINPPDETTYFAMNADSIVVVPYGAFGKNYYDENTFTEVACNISGLIPGYYDSLEISTVIAKTKASHSMNAALKDMIAPVQVNISTVPVISVDDAYICYGDTTMLTANVISGLGPFTYLWSTGDTTQSIYVSPDTTTQYSVLVTGVNGISSDTAYATVTVFPLPVCGITGADTMCPLGTEQYMGPDSMYTYQWIVYGPVTILGDSSLQMVEVMGTGSCDTTYIIELYVVDTNGCASSCSMTVVLFDTLPPIIEDLPDTLFLSCISDVPDTADYFNVYDNCDPSPEVTFADSIANDTICINQATIFRTITVTDTCGNYTMASHIISVFDSIPPVLYGVPADTGVCCADSIPPPANVSAFDNCDGAVGVTLTEIVSDSTGPSYFTLTRIWTAWDTCTNMVSDSMVIEVNDTLYPAGGGMLGIQSDNDIILYYKVSPNPIVNEAKIEFKLTQDADISLELINFTGVKHSTIYDGRINGEEHVSLVFKPEGSMPSGMYLLVLKTPYGLKSKRILLNK